MNQTGAAQAEAAASRSGRHPANLITDGSPEVVALFPNTKSGKPGVMRKGTNDGACYGAESRPPGTQMTGFGDEGSAARFFESYPFDDQPVFYQAKAGKDDRAGSKHPTVKPIALMQALVRHVTPPGGTVLDPFAGSGTTGEAALREGFNCILMEAEPEYIEFLTKRFNSIEATQSQVSTDLTELLS
jgi:site-specific DNA-methyltransferase (adenine-specific)